jgi:pyruvate/2-oxoacid:ferredoxin oxidoreductase alpha subunit
MSCKQDNEKYATINKVRELAKKAAKIDGGRYLIVEKPDKTYIIVKYGESFVGIIKEYIFP